MVYSLHFSPLPSRMIYNRMDICFVGIKLYYNVTECRQQTPEKEERGFFDKALDEILLCAPFPAPPPPTLWPSNPLILFSFPLFS